MQAKEIVKFIEDLSAPLLSSKGIEFVDAEFVKEGGQWFLRLFIDKPNGITIDECADISRELDKNLSDDIFEFPYTFEVSSPGLDRILKREKEYDKYRGRKVEVKLFKPIDNSKLHIGILIGLKDDNIVITDDSGNIKKFPKNVVATTRLHVEI